MTGEGGGAESTLEVNTSVVGVAGGQVWGANYEALESTLKVCTHQGGQGGQIRMVNPKLRTCCETHLATEF